MNRAWKHLAGNILYGADPEKVSLEEIDLLLNEYPYFAALHFMKAAKLATGESPEALGARSKAALYFNNPHWLQILLTAEEQVKENNESLADIMTTRVSEEFQNVNGEEKQVPIAEINLEDSESAYDDKRVESSPENAELISEVQPEVEWMQVIPFKEESSGDSEPVKEELVHEVNWHEEVSLPEPTPEQPAAADAGIQEQIPEAQSPIAADTSNEEALEHNWHIQEPVDIPSQEGEIPVDNEPETQQTDSASDEEAFEQSVWHSREQEEADNTDLPQEGVEKPETDAPPPLKLVFTEPSPESLLPEIPFEPLHTIDYFASQGIRFNAEGKDQLSIKLKSFTEWLKSMKRLHPEKIEHNLPKEEEAHIRETAETSNATQYIVTEAMAEVYIKQGKKDKAIELLEKLSLLDPSKSAYFAVRIKEIKEN